VIDRQTGSLRFNDPHTITCLMQPRPTVVHAKAIWRVKLKRKSCQLFSYEQYILKEHDAIYITDIDETLLDNIACISPSVSPPNTPTKSAVSVLNTKIFVNRLTLFPRYAMVSIIISFLPLTPQYPPAKFISYPLPN
jgi:hypothetical protein